MQFSWLAAIYQLFTVALIILFFVSLYLFVSRIMKHTRETKASLERLEKKMETLSRELRR